MGLPKLKQNKVFTYGLYKNWPEDERWEIINGVPFNMSPGPRRVHHEISGATNFRTPDLGKAKMNKLIHQTIHYKGCSAVFL